MCVFVYMHNRSMYIHIILNKYIHILFYSLLYQKPSKGQADTVPGTQYASMNNTKTPALINLYSKEEDSQRT